MTTISSTEITIRGRSAIAYAKAHGLDTVEKSADPTEGARTVTIDEAEQIARQDPSLLWVAASISVGDEVETRGRVLEVDAARAKAYVVWVSGMRTWTPIEDLRARFA